MTEQEKLLRENIRHMIRHVKQKKLNEENELRTVIRNFMDHELKDLMNEASVADVDPTPNKSTGINVLEELLKKIIPVLETDYKSLTTNKEQRDSFRAHIINAAVNTLTPAKVNTDAGDEAEELQEQDIEVTVDDDAGVDDKLIFEPMLKRLPMKSRKKPIPAMHSVLALRETKRAEIWPTSALRKLKETLSMLMSY